LDGWSGAHGDGHYHRTHGGVSSHPTAGPCPIHVRDGTAHLRCGSQLLAYSAGPGHISDDARCYSDHLADRCVRRSSSVRLGNESTRRGTSVERPGVTCTSANSLSRSAARPTTNAPSGEEPTAPSTPANRTSTGHFRLLSLKLQICKFPFQEGSETWTHACPCVGRGRQNGRSGGLASRRVEWLPSAKKVNGPCPSPRAATSGTAPNAGSRGGKASAKELSVLEADVGRGAARRSRAPKSGTSERRRSAAAGPNDRRVGTPEWDTGSGRYVDPDSATPGA
jgi:hypothetical protein